MRTWTALDWIGYTSLWITVAFTASVEGLKKMPTPPTFTTEPWVAFVPLVFLIVSTIALVVKALAHSRPQAERGSAFHNWPDPYVPKVIAGQTIINNEVLLDGHHYVKCTFLNCTYKYNGTTPLQLQDCTFSGSIMLSSDNPSVEGAYLLMVGMGLTPEGVKLHNLPPSSAIERPKVHSKELA